MQLPVPKLCQKGMKCFSPLTTRKKISEIVQRRLLTTTAASQQQSRGRDSGDDCILKEWALDNRVCRLVLNDARKRNSLSLKMLETLKSAIQECSKNENVRAIVLSSHGPAFSAGHNLKELTTETGLTYHAKVFAACTEVMNLVQDIKIPVICGVKGVAAAAGCQLVASCDIVIAAENSQFSTPGVKLGLFCSTPGVAVSRSVPRKVALDMLLTGRTVSAQTALQCGLVSRVVPEDQVDSEALKVAESICELSKPVIETGKAFFYAQIESDRNTAYRLAQNVMLENLILSDCQEGIAAFLKKRKPIWSHTLKRVKCHI